MANNELKNVLLDMIDGLKNEIEDLNEDIERLSYRAGTTNNVKELDAISHELEDLNEELRENLQEMRALVKRYNKANK